jgi:hypothetical protein
MAILYDYLTLEGDTNWYAAPAAVVSTKNVEAIRINSSGGSGGPLTGPQVISAMAGPSNSTSDAQPASSTTQTTPAAAKRPAAKKTGGQ